MARYLRRNRFRLRLKKQTVYTIVSVVLLAAGSVIFLSFFQQGLILTRVHEEVVYFFGGGGILVAVCIASSGLILLRLKSPLTKPHVTVGLGISTIALIGLTQAGYLGEEFWNTLVTIISTPGALLILFLLLVIGFTILFNTSLDQVVLALVDLFKATRSFFEKYIIATLTIEKSKQPFIASKQLQVKGGSQEELRRGQGAKTAVMPQKALSQQRIMASQNTSLIPTPKAVDLGIWEYPPLSLLAERPGTKADRGDIKKNAAIIEKTLESFGITARVVEVNLGPAVTQYALEIALGTKLSKITALSNDLALALAAPTGQIRIEAPIPGRSLVGIEIPNRTLEFVTLKQMLQADILRQAKSKLSVALGLDVSGAPVIADVAKMPHVLIAGTTGSGKSVLINSWISSLLFRTTPNEVKVILVDPKRVELTGYNGIPHLLTPVIVEVDKILSALKWALAEMDRRYKLFAEVGVRNIDSYNELSGFQALPYIVIFVDELADLMAYAPVEVEDAITRLAQMARATGIHLVIATQRPSVDVITGLIKANIPARIAFNVSSMIDSRVIIDMPGAEKLLGRGDMLYIPPDQAKPTRIQSTFVSEQEVWKLVDYLKKKGIAVEYTEEVTSMPLTWRKSGGAQSGGADGKDELFEEAVRVVCQYDRASASLLQRRLSVGYARAARILDQLEEAGIVGPGEGAKPRDVLVRNADEYMAQRQNTTPAQPS